MIETKPTRQETTINYDYVAPAGYDGSHHKIPEVVDLADKLWDIFFIYARDNFSYSSFEQQHFVPVLTIPGIADLSLG